MKVVINKCFGGFGLSDDAVRQIAKLKGITLYEKSETFGTEFYTDPEMTDESWYDEPNRNDPALVQVVEQMGETANSRNANLAVVEIPDDVEWEIKNYDGREHIAECHQTWG